VTLRGLNLARASVKHHGLAAVAGRELGDELLTVLDREPCRLNHRIEPGVEQARRVAPRREVCQLAQAGPTSALDLATAG